MLRTYVRWFSSSRVELVGIIKDISRSLDQKQSVKECITRITQVDQENLHAQQPSVLVDFAFLCARISKLHFVQYSVKERLKDHVANVGLTVDISSLPSHDVSRFLWASATVKTKPLLPATLGEATIAKSISNQDLCNSIWALSKFASPNDPEILESFSRLVAYLDDTKLTTLSNEDLVSVLRSISNVYIR